MRQFFSNTRFWLFLFFCVLLASCAAIYSFSQTQQETGIARIYQDGELLRTINLSQVTAEERFIIKSKNGGSNTIAIAPGKISVQDATCPDHVCVNQGWIQDGLYPIVCLPNKLVIRIETSNNDKTAPDIMAQ